MQPITLFFGGNSSEYEVSLESATSVYHSMKKQDIPVQCIGINKKGQWFYLPHPSDDFTNERWLEQEKYPLLFDFDPHKPCCHYQQDGKDMVLPLTKALIIMHGANGEDGRLQGLLELAGVTILGCGCLSSALCMDKYRSHQMVNTIGITTAKGILVHTNASYDLDQLTEKLTYPLFVKPNRAGSSFGISKVYNKAELPKAIDNAKVYDSDVIIEQTINGKEIGCGILECRYGKLVSSVDMIDIHDEFYDTHNKYHGSADQIIDPAPLDKDLIVKIKSMALDIFDILGCKGFARIDLFLCDDQTIVFNEVNTIPGFTNHSRYPSMFKSCGINFDGLINLLCEERMDDHE